MPNYLKLAEVGIPLAEDAAALAERQFPSLGSGTSAAIKMLRETVGVASEPAAATGSKIREKASAAVEAASGVKPSFLERAKTVANPYLQEFEAVQADPKYRDALAISRFRKPEGTLGYRQAHKIQETTRYDLTHKYSWAVPNAEALATIAEEGPIIEAGAGSGYWSHLLRQTGADVVAFDKHGSNVAENYYHSNAKMAWTDVVRGTEETVAQYPERSLFMSFPPHGKPFAKNVLDNYSGKRFAFVGELGCGSCTGDQAFHDALETAWQEVKTVSIPNWECASGYLWDALHVFERK
jgi:hypothetical protein